MKQDKRFLKDIEASKVLNVTQYHGWALSDESTVIVSGTSIITDRLANTFNCTDVRISLTTADNTGLTSVNVKKNGSSIFDTIVSIDANEKTSTTATTPFQFTGASSSITFNDDDEISFDITTNGVTATGLKIRLIGTK